MHKSNMPDWFSDILGNLDVLQNALILYEDFSGKFVEINFIVLCWFLQPGQLIIYYELEESEKSSSRGIVEVCPDTHRWEFYLNGSKTNKKVQLQWWFHQFLTSYDCHFRVIRFLEKPQVGLTESRLASVVFYCIQKDKLSCLSDFLNLKPRAADKSFGQFWVGLFI